MTGADAALVAVDDLEVRYHGGPDPAVRDVSLRIGPGEGLLVAGPAGAGKTSLLRGLLGLVPRAGRVSLPARVGYGPQGGGFASGLRVDETARTIAALRGARRPARGGRRTRWPGRGWSSWPAGARAGSTPRAGGA